ncbi:MAG: hypothetical protein KDB27_07180, partial [Planctomycetales bacterium]|nr:hypothetical protein [Planctomycetales bacterium]
MDRAFLLRNLPNRSQVRTLKGEIANFGGPACAALEGYPIAHRNLTGVAAVHFLQSSTFSSMLGTDVW